LDPKFALPGRCCHTSMRSAISHTVFNQRSPSAKRRAGSRNGAHSSAQSRRGHSGQGILLLRLLKDYDAAVRYFEQARQFLPNSSQIPESLAYVARRRGSGTERVLLQRSRAARPAQRFLLTQHAQSYMIVRRFPRRCESLIRCSIYTGRRGYPCAEGGYRTSAGRPSAGCCTPRSAASAADDTAPWKYRFTRRSWNVALHK
jgi:hypothetical protein